MRNSATNCLSCLRPATWLVVPCLFSVGTALLARVAERRDEPPTDTSGTEAAEEVPIRSGDCVHLNLSSSQQLSVNEEGVLGAHLDQAAGFSCVFISKFEDGEIQSGAQLKVGDAVHLRGSDGRFLAVTKGRVQARGYDADDSTAFTLQSAEGSFALVSGARVFLETKSGGFLRVQDSAVDVDGTEPGRENGISLHRLPYGSLHDVVGPDGVYMISVLHDGAAPRAARSLKALSEAKVFPTLLQATEAREAEDGALSLTCPLGEEAGVADWCDDMGREGQTGCTSVMEQAIADSHRRALLRALHRNASQPWTAILEDDAVPVEATEFDQSFREAWAAVPSEARLVRLGWCNSDQDLGYIQEKELSTHGSVRLIGGRWYTDENDQPHYTTGGCTTAYLVHHDILEEMLRIFPCCSAFDKCLEHQLFYKPALRESEEQHEADDHDIMAEEVDVSFIPDLETRAKEELRRWRGSEILVDMDHVSARSNSEGFTAFGQSGLLVQDHRDRQSPDT